MQRVAALFITFALICLTGCAAGSQSRAVKRADEKQAKAVAQKWLEMLDAGDYEEAFEHKSIRFRISGTQKQFVRYMQGRRAPFGQVASRKFIGAASIRKLVGLPDGNYATILFKATFEHKTVAAERVILSKEEGRWQVIEYRIY